MFHSIPTLAKATCSKISNGKSSCHVSDLNFFKYLFLLFFVSMQNLHDFMHCIAAVCVTD